MSRDGVPFPHPSSSIEGDDDPDDGDGAVRSGTHLHSSLSHCSR